jgi:hypothetical protein
MPVGNGSVLPFVPMLEHSASHGVYVLSMEETQPCPHATKQSVRLRRPGVETDQGVENMTVHLGDIDTVECTLCIPRRRRVLVAQSPLLQARPGRIAEETGDGDVLETDDAIAWERDDFLTYHCSCLGLDIR